MPGQADVISSCQACGIPLVWAAHHESGKLAPIVAEPADNGNLLVWRAWPPGGQPELRYAVVGDLEVRSWLSGHGVPLRLNHFADCKLADQFRERS